MAEWAGTGDDEARWRRRLTAVPLNVVVNFDGKPAGMVSATTPGHDGAVELISLWVAPFARGHRVGDAAIETVAAGAREEYRAPSVVLSVKTDNEAAIRLYRRPSFIDVGPSPHDPSERLMRRY